MARRLFTATPEQLAALGVVEVSHEESKDKSSKQKFIMNFLEFSGRVAKDGGGYGIPIGKGLAVHHHHGTSDHLAIPTDEVPERGVELEVYKAVVGKENYWTKGKPIGAVAVAADVNIGLIVSGTFPKLAGQETVLRVTSMPPMVYYRSDAEAELIPVEPESESWDEMNQLAEILTSNEAALKSKFIKD